MSKTLCVLPWMHLASHPSGGVSLCCRSNHKDAASWAKEPNGTMQNFATNPIKDIANSVTFTRVREAMLNGERPVECEGCWQDEDAGLVSKRQYENERWSHIIKDLEQTAVLENPNYRYVELRLGNICNNACVTCNSYSSSKWYSDEVKISKDLPWFTLRPEQNFKWHDKPEFYVELAELSKDVEEIYINGGEPTLIKAHFAYLEKLIQTGQSKQVHLVYSLNMMDIPDRLTELWRSFKQVTVNCSIDDYGDRNFYIRWPTKWSETVASINKLVAIPTVTWHVTQTVSVYNVFNLCELDNWLKEKYNKTVTYNFVLYPDYLSLSAIPSSVKKDIVNLYDGILDDQKKIELFAKLDMPWQPELTIKARDFVVALDKSRNLDYRDYTPELEKIINDKDTNSY